MAGKNRRRRKKKLTSPTPTPNAEPTSPPLTTTTTTANHGTPQAHIDDVLKAENITESVGLMLKLQQQKIKSLVRMNNSSQSLRSEMVQLMKENAEWKQENEHWKQEIENWKKESMVIKTTMVWAQAGGCTHLDGRILEDLEDLRWHIVQGKEDELLQVMEQIDHNFHDPEQRQTMRNKYCEDNKVVLKALERMRIIAEATTKK
ncbi:uncharacterized protein EKO05_0001229 [Ascochyta rabiei]|uniref:Uncharacterized protein n=1 Tax=Didymella rabiei TaxID=5454 RepID=A0A163J3B2_DIDRA|nr:uncharacterized protein EKO05_0001229 [Ascochyta rabiei]KZM26115.1 hypothetical protein ST47_g2745 [Ascochyta rabiei]UPX10578.1 hypothetical protein EKO05_0001229 [Ascochyta rabiei]